PPRVALSCLSIIAQQLVRPKRVLTFANPLRITGSFLVILPLRCVFTFLYFDRRQLALIVGSNRNNEGLQSSHRQHHAPLAFWLVPFFDVSPAHPRLYLLDLLSFRQRTVPQGDGSA